MANGSHVRRLIRADGQRGISRAKGSRVGWQLSKSVRTGLALDDALEMGLWTLEHAGTDGPTRAA